MNNYMQPNGSSLYGNYRARTFSEIFESVPNFYEEWSATPFAETIEELPIDLIFMLLYSRYGNSTIASSDENRFKYQLFSIVFQYAPTWNKELAIQKELRALDIDQIREGAVTVMNQATNPSGEPTTDTNEPLPYINTQNVNKNTRSTIDGYGLVLSLLKDDVTERFLKRFQKLFLTIVQPERPLWYITTEE